MTDIRLRETLLEQLTNCALYFETFCPTETTDGPTPFFCPGFAVPILNGVRRNWALDITDALEVVTRRMGELPWGWWVGEDSASQTSAQLQQLAAVSPGTLPHLASYTDIDTTARVTGLSFRTITAASDMRDYARMWVPASGLEVSLADQVAELELQRPGLGTDYVCIAGEIDGAIVSSAVLLVTENVAGIYAVSTRKDLRRQGIGRDTTLAAVAAARARGISVVSLQAGEQGLELYKKIGFRQISEYTTFYFNLEH